MVGESAAGPLRVDSAWSPLTELRIAMMVVVKALKNPELAAEVHQGSEVLGSQEAFVVGIVKSFDNAVTPGFTFRDKDDFDSEMETKPDQEPKASRMTIRSPERELIVDLEISGDPQTVPLPQEGPTDGQIMLRGDGVQGNGITADIDEMEAVEANSAREIARPHQIQLLYQAWLPGFDFRIVRAQEPRLDRRTKLMSMDNTVDRPDAREHLDAEPPQFPLDGNGSSLSVFLRKQPISYFTDEPFDTMWELSALMMRCS